MTATGFGAMVTDDADTPCPSCGAYNAWSASFCAHCGGRMPGPPRAPLPPPPLPPLIRQGKGTLSASWILTKNSFVILRRNPALLVFPVVQIASTVAALVLAGLGILALHPDLATLPFWLAANGGVMVGLAIVLYLALGVVYTVTAGALMAAARIALEGGRPTARDGWRAARARLGRLIPWAALDATVGVALSIVTQRLGIVGAVIRIAGQVSWAVATYFVLPVLMFEDAGVRAAIPRSAGLFRETYGKTIISNLVLEAIVLAGCFVGLVLAVVGVVGVALGVMSPIIALLAVVAGVVIFAFAVTVGSAAESVLNVSLYRYATTGVIVPALRQDLSASGPTPPLT